MNQSGKIEDIEVVKTHPVPMRQSRGKLEELRAKHKFTKETCASTDSAAKSASDDPRIAAISSKLAPTVYDSLQIIERTDDPIPDANYDNVTRFWVIEKATDAPEANFENQAHKICLLFNLERDEAGGLAKSLSVFSAAGINLAMIYSLPRRDRSWEYTFVLEFEAAANASPNVKAALEQLGEIADFTLLGVFPA